MNLFKPKQKEDNTSDARVTVLESKIRKLETEMLDVITALDSIRNKVLRKIQVRKEDIEENTEIDKQIQKLYKPGQQYLN